MAETRPALAERLKALGWRGLWPWAALLLGLALGRGLGSFLGWCLAWVGVLVLLARAVRWMWRRLVFKVSRRLWVILALLAVVPVAALHVFFLSLGYFSLGGQVSRSVQGNLHSFQEALGQAAAEKDDRMAVQQLRLLGDAWSLRTERLPQGLKPNFVGLVRDRNPRTGEEGVFMRAVHVEGAEYRLLTLDLGRLADRSGALWGGRTHFRLDWPEAKKGKSKVQVTEEGEGTVDVSIPEEDEGAAALSWTKGDPLPGGGLLHPFRLPSVGLRAVDWASGRPMVLTLTPETSLMELFRGYGFTDGDQGNLAGQTLLAMVGIAVLLLLLAVAQVLALLLGVRLAFSLGGSVDELHVGVERLARGDFSARIRPRSRDQIGQLARSFNDMAAQLQESMKEREVRLQLEEELKIAREVQMRLLPDLAALDLPAKVFATVLPALEVAGDYYDLFKLEDGRIAFLIADVSGKGTSAAFYAAETKGVISALDKVKRGPVEIASRLNGIWFRSHDRKVFMTLVYGTYDPADGRFAFVRAGHPAGLLRRAPSSEGVSVERLQPRGLGVGLSEGRFAESLELCEGALHPGDALVFCTDGLTEAQNGAGELYGLERLERLLSQPGLEGLQGAVLADVTEFTEGKGLQDDLTLLILSR